MRPVPRSMALRILVITSATFINTRAALNAALIQDFLNFFGLQLDDEKDNNRDDDCQADYDAQKDPYVKADAQIFHITIAPLSTDKEII